MFRKLAVTIPFLVGVGALTFLVSLQLNKGESFPVWKTIQIGGVSKDELIAEVEKRGVVVDEWARAAIEYQPLSMSPFEYGSFTTSPEVQKINLVRARVQDLGFTEDEGPNVEAVEKRIRELGYKLCPPEVGPWLRAQYTDQPEGGYLIVAMEPVQDTMGRIVVFDLGHDDDGTQWLGAVWAFGHLASKAELVFVLP